MKTRFKMYKIVIAVLLLAAGSALTFISDIWTVPAQNEVAISQLNGNGTDMAIMHTTNSTLRVVRCGIMPIVIMIVIVMGVVEAKRVVNEIEEEEKA
jgi:hypothetical protein